MTRSIRATAVAAGAAVVLLCLAAVAWAANAPQVTDGPTVSGTAQVGSELQAQAKWTGGPPPTAEWAWLRCPRSTGSCTTIAGATSDRYRPTAADVGSLL